ncbi:MAG: DUF4037 domain-containing protein [Acidimicrobiia bacterium]
MAMFVPGLDLARAFYERIVAELVSGVAHAAALVGEGSEVLGFDNDRSTDHSWGPRLQIFVEPDRLDDVRAAVEVGLPKDFEGWPVRFPAWRSGRIDHHVEVTTVADWLEAHLGFDPRPSMTSARWLATPQQLLLEVTAGEVFWDDTGELTAVRKLLSWYPDDVWLWVMACQWHHLSEVEPLVGRTAEVGDELGSRTLAASQVSNAMRLCLLQERRFAPYPKWLGTTFGRSMAAGDLDGPLRAVVEADDHRARETALVQVYETLARRHNQLGVTEPVDATPEPFKVGINEATRPYQVLHAARFATSCQQAIVDENLRKVPLIGSIDQIETTDLLTHFTDLPDRMVSIYEQLTRTASQPDG